MLILLLSLSTPAQANGQTTHLWITETACTHLPAGELADLLSSHSNALRVGTMFPDGGYAVGHGYGEEAHWEPFQERFRDWILENHDDLSSDEAAPYVAFYLGLASHGMADQVFDSMYMERSRVYDAEDGWSVETDTLDTSQDIVFASLTGGQVVSEFTLPEILPSLFADAGIEVEMSTLESGQAWLEIAVDGVSTTSQDEELVSMHTEAFPWGCTHLLDEAVPGAPPMEAEIVARYWQALWAELNGEDVSLEIIGQFPEDGGMGHMATAEDVEARLSVVFNKGLYEGAVSPMVFHVESGGENIPLGLDLFYRNYSHVVNISATDGWEEEAWHTLTIGDDIEATDARRFEEEFTLEFSTLPAADEAIGGAEACGCGTAGGAGGRLLWAAGILGLIWRRRP
jgi:hypothetical protein